MADAGAHDDASQLLSSELGSEWDEYIQQTLQPVTARLREELPKLIEPEVQRMRSTLEQHAQDQLVTPVKESLAQQVNQILAILRNEPGALESPAQERPSAARTKAPKETTRRRSGQRTPVGQPPPGPGSRQSPPIGQPPPGPGRRRPPPGSSRQA
jgi:hypothetical protein